MIAVIALYLESNMEPAVSTVKRGDWCMSEQIITQHLHMHHWGLVKHTK